MSPGTTRNALSALRAFADWCVEHDLLNDNPVLGVRHPKVIPPPPNALTRTQVRALLRVLDAPPRSYIKTWPRNRRCILLMLYAGLRREETANLRWGDLDLERRELAVRYGKGGRSRVVPLCTELLAELCQAGPQPATAPVVPLDRAPGSSVDLPMSHKSIGRIFERWLPKRWQLVLGEPAPLISPHQLRRTFATELYIRGADLLTIQRLLGHADPKTTLRYIAASSEKEHAAVELLRFRDEVAEPDRTSDPQTAVGRLQFREFGT